MTQVAFRLDGDTQIGVGHFMRCLTLANALRNQGAHCHFLSLSLSPPLQNQAKNDGHGVQIFEDEGALLKGLASQTRDWLVVDHYQLGPDFEQPAKAFCRALMVIEDLSQRHHHADLLVDQSALRSPTDFEGFVPPTCTLLLGPKYALIRPEFRENQKQSANRWAKGLISFGGADPHNTSLKVLKLLAETTELAQIQWTLIAGPTNPHLKVLQQFSTQSSLNLHIIPSTNSMATLMAEHDFAIGAAGGMTWERACVGIPTLAMPIAKNQLAAIEILAHFKLAETLQLSELNSENLVNRLGILRKKSHAYLQRNQKFVDGLGAQRISQAMLSENSSFNQ